MSTNSSENFELYKPRLTDALRSHYSILQQYYKTFVKKYQIYYAHKVRQVLNEKELQMLDRHIDGYACNSKPFQLVPGIVFLTVKKLKPA